METNAVVQYERQQLPIKTMDDISAIGNMIAQSGWFGSCSPGRGSLIAAGLHQEGLSVFEFKRLYHVTDRGDVSMRADAMLAEFHKRGGTVVWTEFSDTRAAGVWSYRENENVKIEYTIEHAKRAGLVRSKGAWETNPDAMLRARLVSKAIRMLCPEAVAGLYTPEEMADIHRDEPAPSGPPRPMAAQEAEAIIEAIVTQAPSPFPPDAPTEAAPIDYAICPVGRSKGMRWADMPFEHLELALEVEHPDLEPAHKEAIKAAIREHEKEPTQ